MEIINLEIPDEVSVKIQSYRDKLSELLLLGLQQLKIQEALLLYSRGLISFGKTAEWAGLSEAEMICHARASRVQPRWSEEMAQEELA